MVFEQITEQNYPFVQSIYEEGIATENATFQTKASSWEEWNKSHSSHSRLLANVNNEYVGWAALSPVSSRCVYEGVAEVSVYVGSQHRNKGYGVMLLNKLIQASEENGIWTLQSGIFPENKSSIKIHEACGFRIIGTREKIGKMNGIWRDNLFLERRSLINGK